MPLFYQRALYQGILCQINREYHFVLFAICFVLLTACSDAVQEATDKSNDSAAKLLSIQLSPNNPAVSRDTTLPLSAIGIYSNNTKSDITNEVAWQSSNTDAVSFDTSTDARPGVVIGKIEGEASVSASLGVVTSTYIKVSVINSPLRSIEVTPKYSHSVFSSALIDQKFIATGYYANGSVQDLSGNVDWISLDPDIIQFSASEPAGVARTSGSAGEAHIHANYNGVESNSAVFLVGPKSLNKIQIYPLKTSMGIGTHKQFFANADQEDSSTQDLTSNVKWVSSDTGVATISIVFGSKGLVTAVAAGTTTITAEFNGQISTEASLTITNARLKEIQINSPLLANGISPARFALRTNAHFYAIGRYDDSVTVQDLSEDVIWRSHSENNELNVFIDSARGYSGIATAVFIGKTFISASFNGVSSDLISINVTDDVLQTIDIIPSESTLVLGAAQMFTAIGNFASLSGQITRQDISDSARWVSSGDSVVSLEPHYNNGALATAIGIGGPISITASLIVPNTGIITSTPTMITVEDAKLTGISILQAVDSVALGDSLSFVAEGQYSNPSTSTVYTRDITNLVTWQSNNIKIATTSNFVDQRGIVESVAQGTTTISASLENLSATAQLTVTAPIMRSLTITPTTATVQIGNSQQFSAKSTYSDGTFKDVTNQAIWESGEIVIATTTNTGKVTAVAAGDTTINASITNSEGATILATSQLTVTALAPALAITTSALSVTQGESLQFLASGGPPPFVWRVDNANAVINPDSGLLTGTTPGMVTITVIDSNSKSDSVTIEITSAPIILQTIDVTPSIKYLDSGQQQQFTAMGNYAGQVPQDLTNTILWATSDSNIVAFSTITSGLAVSVLGKTGTVTITATSTNNAVVGQATLHIRAPTIVVSSTSNVFSINSSTQFTATGGNGNYIWSLSANSAGIATVDTNGILTILDKTGTFDVIATDANGFSGQMTIVVSANIPINGLFLDPVLQACVDASTVPAPGSTVVTTDQITGISCWGGGVNKVKSVEGLQYLTNLTLLDLTTNNITDITPLSGLVNLVTLVLNNNNLGAAASDKIVDFGPLRSLSNLQYFSIKIARIDAQTDISAFSGLTSLVTLDMEGNISTSTKMMAISGLVNIKNLALPGLGLTDLGFLSGLINITNLDLGANQLTAITEISNLTKIAVLNLSGNQITDISPLTALKDVTGTGALQSIRLEGNAGLDTTIFNQTFDAPNTYSNLQYLNLTGDGLTSISSIGNLTSLQTLLLQNNAITDLTSLSTLTSLTELNLNSNYITDLAGIEGATSLRKLDLTSNPRVNPNTPTIPAGTLLQSSLVSLSSLSLLQHLQLNYTGISDVSALSPLTSLIALNMAYNNIVDVNPLASLVNIGYLGLSGNKITGLSNGNVNNLRTLIKASTINLTSNITMSCVELSELQTALNTVSVVVQPNVVISAGTTANCSLP